MKTIYKYTIILIVLFIASISMAAEKTYGDITVCQIVSVYDGDTFKVDVPGWPDIVGKNMSIRIYGIDTPEIKGTSGRIKDTALRARTELTNILTFGKLIELRNMRRGKYFRIIADVYVDGKNVAKAMIDKGLAKEYYGGARPIW